MPTRELHGLRLSTQTMQTSEEEEVKASLGAETRLMRA
jgi:hypothetical protein